MPRFTAEGQTAEEALETYFTTLQVPILRGRAFLSSDRKGAQRVAIVSDEAAARAWPGQDPIGRRLKMGGPTSSSEWLIIVGVAATTRYRELAAPRPTLYVPAEQFMVTAGRLAIRTSAEPAFIAGAVRERVRSVDQLVQVLRRASRGLHGGTTGMAAFQHAPSVCLRPRRAALVQRWPLRRGRRICAPAFCGDRCSRGARRDTA